MLQERIHALDFQGFEGCVRTSGIDRPGETFRGSELLLIETKIRGCIGHANGSRPHGTRKGTRSTRARAQASFHSRVCATTCIRSASPRGITACNRSGSSVLGPARVPGSSSSRTIRSRRCTIGGTAAACISRTTAKVSTQLTSSLRGGLVSAVLSRAAEGAVASVFDVQLRELVCQATSASVTTVAAASGACSSVSACRGAAGRFRVVCSAGPSITRSAGSRESKGSGSACVEALATFPGNSSSGISLTGITQLVIVTTTLA